MRNIIISIILMSGLFAPGISHAGSQCSLRATILEANLGWGKDTIDFYISWSMIPRIVLKTPMQDRLMFGEDWGRTDCP